ncbi:MAG: hypothetical protein K6E38_04910 [Fretibacterium sp.]|nr:hypothetical protein [Fretibacterium sp.]
MNRYVLLPGNPERGDVTAKEWDEARFVVNNREHRTWSGTLEGIPITVCSAGMGPRLSLEEYRLDCRKKNHFINLGPTFPLDMRDFSKVDPAALIRFPGGQLGA